MECRSGISEGVAAARLAFGDQADPEGQYSAFRAKRKPIQPVPVLGSPLLTKETVQKSAASIHLPPRIAVGVGFWAYLALR